MMPTIERFEVMPKDGKLTLESLPFRVGETLHVLVFPHHTPKENKQEKLRGSVIQYQEPFAPVAAEDWESLK